MLAARPAQVVAESLVALNALEAMSCGGPGGTVLALVLISPRW